MWSLTLDQTGFKSKDLNARLVLVPHMIPRIQALLRVANLRNATMDLPS